MGTDTRADGHAVEKPVAKGKTRELTGDELEALSEQRDFLLRSLADLEAEHEAGDVDDDDYESLREDYTRRAARVIRAIERHRVPVARERKRRPAEVRRRWQVGVVLAGVVIFALVAGVLVAQVAGRRDANDTVTGEIRPSTAGQLAEAFDQFRRGDYEGAVATYDEILAENPDNAEALTYKGWALAQSGGDPVDTIDLMVSATEVDPEYPDAHALLVVVYWQLAQAQPEVANELLPRARAELEVLDELGMPEDMAAQLEPIRRQLEED